MNGAEKIKNKILEEAKNEVEKILVESKEGEEEIRSKNMKSEKEYASSRRDDMKRSVKLYKDKTLAQSRLKVKREYLAERENIVESFLIEGLKDIDHSSKEYSSYLKVLIEKSVKILSGDITVFCNKNDKSIVKKISGDLKLDVANINGGLIFEDSIGGKIDESLDSKMERKMDELRRVIVKNIES